MEEIDNQSGVLTGYWLLFFKTHKSLAYVRNHLVFRPSWNFSCVLNGAASQAHARTLLDSFTRQSRALAAKIWKTYWTSHPSYSFWTACNGFWPKGKPACPSQLQCYKPTLQISAWPKSLLAIPVSQEHGRRLLNVNKEHNSKNHWVSFCSLHRIAGRACTEITVAAARE